MLELNNNQARKTMSAYNYLQCICQSWINLLIFRYVWRL